MKYKLIALDLDGTVLDDNKEISKENLDAIKRAQNAGVAVAIATGRAPDGTIFLKEKLGMSGYSIVIGGAQILDEKNNDIYSCYIPPQITENMIQYLIEKNIYFQIYLNDNKFYYLNRTKYTEEYEQACRYSGYQDDFFLHEKELFATKILAITSPEDEYSTYEMFKRDFPELNICISQTGYVEAANKLSTKGYALLKLADILGIDKSRTIAVGDSLIDSSMIIEAGLGVAMANARPEVKDVADYITQADCNNSGVAEVINKFIFGEA